MSYLAIKNFGLTSFHKDHPPRILNLNSKLGDVVVVLGKNGVGKTTLLRQLAALGPTLLQPNQVVLDGKDISTLHRSKRAKLVSFMPHKMETTIDLTCYELLLMARFNQHHGFPVKKDRQTVDRYLTFFGAADLATRQYQQLSSGEQRRVQIARVFAADTPLTILDEPFTSLDPLMAQRMARLVQEQANSRVVILSSHHLEVSLGIATAVITIKDQELRVWQREQDGFKLPELAELYS